MSMWGRAQDAAHSVLWGYDTQTEHVPGELEKLGIKYEDARTVDDLLLDAVVPVVEGFWRKLHHDEKARADRAEAENKRLREALDSIRTEVAKVPHHRVDTEGVSTALENIEDLVATDSEPAGAEQGDAP